MNKKLYTGLIVLGGVGVFALALGAQAYQGDPTKFGPNHTPERHIAVQESLEKNDYAAWKEQMGGGGITKRINEENFSRFVEMRKLQLEGKTEEAAKIRAELGLGNGENKKNGRGMYGANRGKNNGGNFIDTDGNGICNRL